MMAAIAPARLESPMKSTFEYNRRKLLTLELFERAFPDFLSPNTYAWQTRCLPARRAYTYLKHLWKWGLLERRQSPICYRLTPRGRERLAWLYREIPVIPSVSAHA